MCPHYELSEGEHKKLEWMKKKNDSWLTSHTSSQFYALHGWHDYNYQSILMLEQEMHKQSIIYQEM